MSREKICLFFATTASMLLLAILVCGFCCLSAVEASQSEMLKGEVRVSKNDALVTTIFRTPSGGKVTAFLPLNVQQDDEIGGTVERQLPPPRPDQTAQNQDAATDEIAGVVTIEPQHKQPEFPPTTCPPNKSSFTCPCPSDGSYVVTYTPPNGPPCTATVQCPPMPPAPPTSTCGIPQLTSCNGNMHVSMQCPSGSAASNSCMIGGQESTCRAWSNEGCVFHVPPASQLPPGPSSVIVKRGNKMAIGQTLVAQIKMTCSPNNLTQGQPCQVTTIVNCPGIHTIQNGVLTIKNYNPAVLNMADKVIPIPYNPSSQAPTASELRKQDNMKMVKGLKERLANSTEAATPQGQKLLGALNEIEQKLGRP